MINKFQDSGSSQSRKKKNFAYRDGLQTIQTSKKIAGNNTSFLPGMDGSGDKHALLLSNLENTNLSPRVDQEQYLRPLSKTSHVGQVPDKAVDQVGDDWEVQDESSLTNRSIQQFMCSASRHFNTQKRSELELSKQAVATRLVGNAWRTGEQDQGQLSEVRDRAQQLVQTVSLQAAIDAQDTPGRTQRVSAEQTNLALLSLSANVQSTPRPQQKYFNDQAEADKLCISESARESESQRAAQAKQKRRQKQ